MIEYENRFEKLHIWNRDHLSFQPHFHDSIEIAIIKEGHVSASADYCEVDLKSGDIFIVFPNQIHSYEDKGNIDAKLVIVPRKYCKPLNEIITTSVPSSPVIRASDLTWRILNLVHEIDLEKHVYSNRYAHEVTEGCMEAILALLFSQLTFVCRNRDDELIERKIISYCVEHYTDELTVDSISKELHISKYIISNFFSTKIKINFRDFINNLRLDDSIKRILSGESISAAALDSGFSSIRTFNRVFLSKMGITPSAYMDAYKSKQSQK